MRVRVFLAIIVLGLVAVGTAGLIGWRRDHAKLKKSGFTEQRLAFVEAENRRLQDVLVQQQRAADAAATREGRKEMEGVVTGLRGMSFLESVVYREIPRSELPSILRQKLSQQVPDQEFEHTAIAYAALGLIPEGIDLKKTYLGLLGEQVGAFYDQHSHELFTFSGQSLASSQNRIIMAHELTHALEDQHFRLERLPLEAKGNDDRALAASALVEGDATLVMNRYFLGNVTADLVRENLAATIATDVHQLATAPRYLRETLLFPYLKGQEFCQTLYERGGWPALARAFEQPPSSTSQILHPERFLADPREEPISIELPDTDVQITQPIVDNVLGEFGTRQLLSVWLRNEAKAAEMASGWRGDRYIVYGDGAATSYVWETAWRSPGQAEEFAAAVTGARVSTARSAGRARPGFTVMSDSVGQRALVICAQDARWLDTLKTRFAVKFNAPMAKPDSHP